MFVIYTKYLLFYFRGWSTAFKNTLLYFICKDRRPFHIVQGAGFKRLMKELVPSYKVPCPATLKKVLDDKYEITKISFIKTLEDVQHMSLTFDVWTETMTETSFLGVTVHFSR